MVDPDHHTMPEQFVRDVWEGQLFTTGGLHTSDGRPIVIMSPGNVNTDSGPDFTGACIRIGGTTFRGDVEIHRNAAAWEAHGHDADPHYNSVILHVVMTNDQVSPPTRTESKRNLPVLVLHPFLDPNLYAVWRESFASTYCDRQLACFRRNDDVPEQIILQTLERLAVQRIELKVRRFEERLKELIDEMNTTFREPYPRYYGNPDEIPAPVSRCTQKECSRKEHWLRWPYCSPRSS